jgi:hypothetical protein
MSRSDGFRQRLALVIVLMAAMAWRYRNNRAVFFVMVGTIFAALALVAGDQVPERIVQSLALAWAACMLIAGVSAISELVYRLRKKKDNVVMPAGREHKN